MKKSIFVLIGLLAIFSLVPVLSARAGDLTAVTVSLTNVYGSYNGNYTINFTMASGTPANGQIKLSFPAEFNLTGIATSTMTLTGFGEGGVIATSTTGASGTTQVITLFLADGTNSANGAAASATIANIVSPSAGGSFTVIAETLTEAAEAIDIGTSAAFSIFGGRQTPSLYSDALPPASKITSPTEGLTISVGEKYVIQGTAQDQGGSTVQKVEVSLDGGQNWSMAEIKSALANVFSWEYVWQNPIKGEYVIKVRATDAVGNIESPLTGKRVTVSVIVPSTPVPEKPITEMTAQELETKITEIQQKIVDILTQLIQLFQQQIQTLLAK